MELGFIHSLNQGGMNLVNYLTQVANDDDSVDSQDADNTDLHIGSS